MTAIAADRPSCPHAAGRVVAAVGGLDPQTRLTFPMRRAAVLQTLEGEAGAPELCLFVGGQEISFDDPRFFAFARGLADHDAFVASDAGTWGDDTSWAEIAPLLDALIEAGVLVPADQAAPSFRLIPGPRPSPLPPAQSVRPRSWSELPGLMTELTGRSLEIGWLELVTPVFRVAHPALDADGRQVGEANVFPPTLRLDVPTRWRTCLFAGTRHQQDRPMNVEALRAMQAHWTQMMTAVARIRAAYLQRVPGACDGGWTIGALERLAVCILAVPTLVVTQTGEPLHPVLSSLFRVTDGVRMVMHQMLFVPIGEAARSPHARVTAAEIHAYAERNYSFHSETGVCAGPPEMVAELLSVLVDGKAPDATPLDPAVEAALADVEAAMDYAFLGLQAHAAIFSIWPAMSRAYRQLHDALAAEHGETSAVTRRFADHLETLQRTTYLWDEAHLVQRDLVYDDMWAASARALGNPPSEGLPLRLARPLPGADELERALAADVGAPVAAAVTRFAAEVSAAIAAAQGPQLRLSQSLGRPAPERPFDSDDANLHVRLQRPAEGRLPYLFDELRDAFGLDLVVTARGVEARSSHPIRRLDRPNSAGAPSRSNSTGEIP